MLIKQVKKLWKLFSVSHKIRIIRLFFLMTVGMMLEIFGVALIIPTFSILLQDDVAADFPEMIYIIELLGNPSKEILG